jgi:hypothetical protein
LWLVQRFSASLITKKLLIICGLSWLRRYKGQQSVRRFALANRLFISRKFDYSLWQYLISNQSCDLYWSTWPMGQ